MLNLNNIPEAPSSNQFDLIPDNTVVRAILKLSGGDMALPEFGDGNYFKASQTTNAKWLPIEMTIMGGQFDKRKVWHNIFVDGNKLNDQGVPLAKVIGLQMLKSIIDSNFNLDPKDQSPQAQQSRNLMGVNQLDGMNVCFKIGIEKGQNGYDPRNKIKAILTLGQNGYMPVGQVPASAPAQPQAAAPAPSTATAGVVPTWAQ